MNKILFSLFVFVLSACGPAVVSTPDFAQPIAPNILAVGANQTAQAARQEADFYNAQSSATSAASTSIAHAPIIAMTQTRAAFDMVQVYAAATSTAAAVTQTADAERAAYLAASTSTSGAATAVAAFTAQAFMVQQNNDQLAFERAQTTNTMKAVAAYAVLFIAVIVGILYAFVHLKRLSFSPVGVDEHGKVLPLLNYIDAIVVDADRLANGMGILTAEYVKSLPAITPERQATVTAAAQFVDLNTRRARLPRSLVQSQGLLPEPADDEAAEQSDFLLPAWEIINGWDGKNGLPYYTAHGLELIDVDRFPHLAVLGATGTGKSRRFLRPLIACALAAGHRVVIVGKSADYLPFVNHPNASLLRVASITQPGQAQRYAGVLEALVVEMNRRDDVLSAARQSTWTHAGHPRTDIVLDEVGNALRLMDAATSRQARIWIEGLVAEGRKVGFHLWLANQRATGMAAILSQTGKAIFQVAPDEERAHQSLRGAAALRDGYFIANFGSVKLAGGFEPSDVELVKFMNDRPVAALDPEPWIEGVVLPADALPADAPAPVRLQAPVPASTVAEFVNSLSPWQLEALDLHQAGLEPEHIVAKIFAGDDPAIGATALAALLNDWRQVKGVQAPSEDERIQFLVGQGRTVSAIVKELWGVTGGVKFGPLADRVRAFVPAAVAGMGASGSTSTAPITPVSD